MKTIERGMVLCVSRDWYDHYGIYVGNDEVVHFTSHSSDKNSDNSIMKTSMRLFIRDAREFHVMSFDEVAKRGNWNTIAKTIALAVLGAISGPAAATVAVVYYASNGLAAAKNLYNWFETNSYKLYSREECAQRAEKCLGFADYNVLLNNCEHFALWCKIGIHTSTQANKLIELGIGKSRKLKADDYIAL